MCQPNAATVQPHPTVVAQPIQIPLTSPLQTARNPWIRAMRPLQRPNLQTAPNQPTVIAASVSTGLSGKETHKSEGAGAQSSPAYMTPHLMTPPAMSAPNLRAASAGFVRSPLIRGIRPMQQTSPQLAPPQATSVPSPVLTEMKSEVSITPSKLNGVKSYPTVVTPPVMTPPAMSTPTLRAASAGFVRSPLIRGIRPMQQKSTPLAPSQAASAPPPGSTEDSAKKTNMSEVPGAQSSPDINGNQSHAAVMAQRMMTPAAISPPILGAASARIVHSPLSRNVHPMQPASTQLDPPQATSSVPFPSSTRDSDQEAKKSEYTGAQSFSDKNGTPSHPTVMTPRMMTPTVFSPPILRAGSAGIVRNTWIRSIRPLQQTGSQVVPNPASSHTESSGPQLNTLAEADVHSAEAQIEPHSSPTQALQEISPHSSNSSLASIPQSPSLVDSPSDSSLKSLSPEPQVTPDTSCSSPESGTPSTVSDLAPPVSPPRLMQRGLLGDKGECEVNYLQMNLDKMPDVAYQYHVCIEPERPSKFARPAFELFNEKFFKDITMVYDGMRLAYTIEKLPCKYFKGEVQVEESNMRKFSMTVRIQETENPEVDLKSLKTYHCDRVYDKPMRALQCLETVLTSPCHNGSIRIGRAFYTKPKEFFDLKDGFEMWLGLFQAPILGDAPYLNVDVANKSFPSSTTLTEYLRKQSLASNFDAPLDRRSLTKLRMFLKGVAITYTPPACFGSFARIHAYIDVVDTSASKLQFECQGTKMSIAGYYESRNYRLRYPNLNCLQLGKKEKHMYIPMELCSIQGGQTVRPMDGPRQVQELIRFAATSTDVRRRKINSLLERFQHNRDIKVQVFGIRLSNKFLRVETRFLLAPTLEYFNKEQIRPSNGSWRPGNQTKFFCTKSAASGIKWAVIYDKRSKIQYGNADELATMLMRAGRALNLILAAKPLISAFTDLETSLKDLKRDKYELVVTVIPTFGVSYAQIKQDAELKHGILTQCIKEETLKRRCSMQLANNLILKLNAKLNGINHKLGGRAAAFEAKDVMFLGGDVTHPTPDQRRIPSVVGVVGSHDAHGTCYNMQYRLQDSASELIKEMEAIVTFHLKMYYQSQGKYPSYIIYYRDGVSEGEITALKKQELTAIRAALARLQITAKITCIVVVKRHHTRFFPTVRDPRDKFNNVKPGTVVDQKIVHPAEKQFFMVSHESIQGTAKPTRYHVVEDDTDFKIDYLQSLTYNLCHLFPRCNRSVSYPAPAYLAHLAAARGKVYIEGGKDLQHNHLKDEYRRREISGALMKCNPMYFV